MVQARLGKTMAPSGAGFDSSCFRHFWMLISLGAGTALKAEGTGNGLGFESSDIRHSLTCSLTIERLALN